MLNTLLSLSPRRRAEEERVERFVAAIRATGPARPAAPVRTDTVAVPRIVLTTAVPLALAAVLLSGGMSSPAAAATVAPVQTAAAAPHVPCHLHLTELSRMVCAFSETVAVTAHAITPR